MACVAPLNCGDCAQVGGGGNAALRHVALDTCFIKVKVKFSHTRYRALGPELIPVYRQSARR